MEHPEIKLSLNTLRACILATALAAQAGAAAAQELLIYGGPKRSEFLGCFNCSKFAPDSICNTFGKGRLFASEIFDAFGEYGSRHSLSSPWNRHSSAASVPVLLDRTGKFYGYFTINERRSDAVGFARQLKRIHETAGGDLIAVQRLLCDAINR